MNHCTLMTPEELARSSDDDNESGFGCLSTDKGRLPLKAMDVKSKIAGLVSHVTLRQTFVNSFDEPIEATYIFPLPSRAAVTGFRMEVNGREITGEIVERGEARETYDQAIADGHRAAIAEEERSGVFTTRVGNLMPGEEAIVRLTITGPLPYVDGEAEFRFPLVVAPRYMPGKALAGDSVGDGVAPDTDAVPDASRISPPVLLPGFPNPVSLQLEVEVDPLELPLTALRSSLHAALSESEGRVHTVRLQPGERLDRDFILRFQLGEDSIGSSLAVNDGTFQLTLVPPISTSKAQRPRDVVFVLDRSGSMDGWKIIAARRAAARMVDSLSDRDNLGVLSFDHIIDIPDGFTDGALVPATDRNRFRAVEFLAGLDARGGTEMALPLQKAAKMLAGGYADRERVLVLVTDGQVGNEDQILRGLSRELKNVRVFTLGIDRAVNEGFLKRLAAVGGGAMELVESEDRLDEVMDRIHRRIGTPVLTEVVVEADGLSIEADSIVPGRMPDLFAGAPLVVRGRCEGDAAGSIVVKATAADGTAWTEKLAARTTDNAALGSLWARGSIRELEDRYVLGRGDLGVLERRIVQTSIEFGVLSRFTAFVAVDRAEKVNVGGDNHKVTQAVDAPQGWGMLRGQGRAASTTLMPAMACAPEPMDMMRAMPAGGRIAGGGAPKRPEMKRKAGLLGNLFGSVFERRLDEEDGELLEEESGIDLVAYRRRARALLRSPASKTPAVFADELAALIQHLESVGAPDDEVEPLREALNALRADSSTLDEAREVLEAFADGGSAPGRARGAFWK